MLKSYGLTQSCQVLDLLFSAFCCSVDAVPCRISFERGKERHFFFLAISVGTFGWVVLAEELPLKQHYGVVRVTAPLAGCNVSEAVLYLSFTIAIDYVLIAM